MRSDQSRRLTLLLACAALGGIVFLLAWGGIRLTRENDRIAAVWLANGVIVAALLRQPVTRWPSFLVGAWVGNIAANLVSGDSAPFAAALSTINQVECAIVAGMTAPVFGRKLRIDDGVVIGRFLIAATIGATISGLLAAALLFVVANAPPVRLFANWAASDGLGLLIVTPLLLAARAEERQTKWRDIVEPAAMLICAVGASFAIFWHSEQPILFSLALLVFYAALRLRLFAALSVVVAISAVGLVATLAGHGVIAKANIDPTERMYVFQLFVAIQLFSVLPIRALIAERDRLGIAAAESERLFRRISEASPAGILHLDASGRATFVNQRWTQLTGLRFDQLSGDRWIDTIDRSFRSAARSLWAEARATDVPVSGEYPFVRPGGNSGWAELNIFPEVDGLKLLGFVVRFTDITDRRLADEILQERERRYRLVTENAHDVIVRVDETGEVQYVSSAIERLFGILPADVVGRPFASIVHDADLPVVSRLGSGEIDLDEPVLRFRIKDGNGRCIWVESSFRPLADSATGRLTETVLSIRDIERRVQQEEKAAETDARLRERNRLLHMAEELAEVGHWRLDLETGAIDCSRHTRQIAQIASRSTVTPAVALSAINPADRPRVLRALATARLTQERQLLPIRVGEGEGLRHVRLGVQADVDLGGRVTGLFGVVRDKTEFIVAQEQLIEARDEAQAAARAKSHFLATMSHEIRTPMTGVLGMIDLLRDEADGANRERYFATLKQSADLLMAVLDDVLDFSKIDSGALKLDLTSFDLRQMVASTVELFGNAASRKGILLSFDANCDGDMVVADPVRIQQVVSNLLSNAIKFTSRGHVRVTLADAPIDQGKRPWTIAIEDTGIGIADDVVGGLFQPFVQAERSTSRKFGGTGLGLAISQRLVDAMGGELAVTSKLGVGSVFEVTLPLREGQGEATLTDPVQVRDAERQLEGSRALEILVAEDNPVNQLLIGAILRKLDHKVTMVENGRLAVEACRDRRFDAILMDMQMPEMDGLAATRSVRAMAGWRKTVPIVALTADASPERRRFYDGVGLSHFMTKPIDQDALADLLRQIGAGATTVPADATEIADRAG